MKCFLFALLFSLFAIKANEKPNVLLILVDDMGYSDIGCMGSEIPTPHLDSLASNGMLFTQAYNTAKCFSTRASLLSGVYFQQTDKDFTNTNLIAEVLKPQGYTSLWAGKHHASFDPRTRGFDRFYGFLGGAVSFWNPSMVQREGVGKPANIGESPWILDSDEKTLPFTPDKDWYATDAFTDKGIAWLEEYKDDKPFFLYMAYNAPHWPLHAHKEDIDLFKGKYDAGFEAIRAARFKRQMDENILGPSVKELAVPDWNEIWSELSPKEKEQYARRMEIHAAMMKNLDDNIGRLVTKLKEQGRLDNTLIFFLGDNGASPESPDGRVKNFDVNNLSGDETSYPSIRKSWAVTANTPLNLYKSSSFEGGTNTPMIVHWPKGIKKTGTNNHTPVHLVDIMPTLVELGGAEYKASEKIPPMQGVSMTALFKGESINRENPLFFQYAGGSALRDGDYKLVRRNYKKPWELYKVSTDRVEKHNLAKEMPEKVEAMNKAWQQKFKDMTGSSFTDHLKENEQKKKEKAAKIAKRKKK
ncbi:arylsulfatase (aryl-sulfate sulphohydrolase) [Lentisphaera araneosa HTCC2155]|uniref:Arylsulfatase (Aryl-sulfate sulphohydrolase) n=1 Tax=Lentisphaera araneosa HTCC2155 TaxID=313628 RepID=A6DJ52_9BACT|nr:arylsulfatase [Lentisphaera araneosa]EDM28488.1 arylsulfatase (aryl-sulfate sulphohydrolase) [Lentisphaera araneosa HTCC2155]